MTNNSLCDTCKYSDNCERSDKGISFANTTVCWKYDKEADNEKDKVH